ncbi:hypothetical protein, partial [Klebsiella pneumoniae]|uniref:hypothetical protein n=1 Tax=Klebsiella pneumoniae TaxID=573 RepID=UPI003851E233
WTDWITLSNGIQSTINDLIFGLEYRVVLTDGWDAFAGGQPLRPMVSSLYHMEVIPSVQYLVTYPYDINGMFFEYVLSASVDL